MRGKPKLTRSHRPDLAARDLLTMSAQEDSIARVATNVSNRKSAKGKGKAIVVNPASAHLQSRHGDSEKTQSQRKVVYKSFLDTPFTVKWLKKNPSIYLYDRADARWYRRPNIPLNIQNTIFACLVDALSESGVANYHLDRERAGRERKKIVRREKRKEKERSNETGGKRKRTEEEEEEEGQDGRERKRRKDDSTLTQGPDRGSEGPPANLDVAPGDVDKTPKTEVPRPSILSHLTIGINEVTKRLEAQTRHWRTFRNRTTGVELDYGGPDGEEATA
jgi:ribonuclease P/MRP protein subunit POP3